LGRCARFFVSQLYIHKQMSKTSSPLKRPSRKGQPLQKKTRATDDGSVSSELREAQHKIALLVAENGKLVAEKDAMAARMERAKAEIQQRMATMQAGIQERLQAGESKSGIMEYVKAGFGAMLGVLAALLVVNLAVGALDALTSSPNNDATYDDEASPSMESDDVPSSNSGMGDMFEFGGGGGGVSARNKQGKQQAKKTNTLNTSSLTRKASKASSSPRSRKASR